MTTLLDSLRPQPGRYHELFSANGQLRPHWQPMANALRKLSPAQMQQRDDLVTRRIQENGVTYALYGEKQDRSWRVGALPNLIPPDEWQVIADGVAQRARLLNAVAQDIYGPQRLLNEGLLPPELIFGHPNYLAACRDVKPPKGCYVHVYAADLARASNGQWWVMADRTQAPSGAGYALENRQVVASAFPEPFRELGVQSLSPFFDALLDTLKRQAPCGDESPLVVLLSPGRYSETYFEHVYLARHLGIPLVEGHDLSVRQPYVYLKTLSGLRRVHAIYRRTDDSYCDPLELRNESALGVPGLLAVARAGHVLIANALGSGVLESQGLLGFLPAISEHLLGEPLSLPSAATWWCGEPAVMKEALKRLDELVIKPVFSSQRFDPVFGRDLSPSARESLRERIRQRPYVYLAQERMQLAQAPMWHRDSQRFHNHACGMRVYAVATESGYVVMPGALTRVAASPDDDVMSMQRGGTSKDTWVCFSAKPRLHLPQDQRIRLRDLRRVDPYLPSRIAENLFWLGRYAERADHHARLIRSALTRHMEADPSQGIGMMLALHYGQSLKLFSGEVELTPMLLNSLHSDGSHLDLLSTLRALVSSSSQVHRYLSQENWQAIVELEAEARELRPEVLDPATALNFIDRLMTTLSALSGFALDDMTQDVSWSFLMLGRRLERLQGQAQLLQTVLESPASEGSESLDWLLEMANSRITYRLRYLTQAQWLPVLDLLLLDPSNPHGLGHQINHLLSMMRNLGSRDLTLMQTAHDDLASLDLSVIDGVLGFPERLQRCLKCLNPLIADVQRAALGVGNGIALQFFAHVDDDSQQMSSS
ncbi:MAG: circularly permuted type 2 ATP-grasp protein [Paraperlucidibaca sp.]